MTTPWEKVSRARDLKPIAPDHKDVDTESDSSWEIVPMTVSRYVRQIIEARAEKAGLRPADYIWQVVLMDRIREWTADEVKRMAGERRAARKLVTNIHMKTELDSDLRELAETPADADTIAALPADDERADVAA